MASPSGYLAPGDSFAQTGSEFNLDLSSDDEDLRSEVTGGPSGGGEAYEMRDGAGAAGASSSSRGRGAWDDSTSAIEDDDDDDAFDSARPGNRRFSRTSTVASFQLYTPDEEATVRRKFDRRLVLFVALLYMLSFLDRSSTTSPAPQILRPSSIN
jgi:hypothetical protein